MYSYANKFNIATNQDKSEVVLSFMQESPEFALAPTVDENGKVSVETTIKSEPIANIVVTGAFAKEIANIITSLTSQDD